MIIKASERNTEHTTEGRDHFALLEFVKDDAPEQVIADAKYLRGLLDRGTAMSCF
jgi:hypothetical protein